jgi:hypothetical protein
MEQHGLGRDEWLEKLTLVDHLLYLDTMGGNEIDS